MNEFTTLEILALMLSIILPLLYIPYWIKGKIGQKETW